MRIENNILKEVLNSDINDLGEFIIPEGVKTIGDYAFYKCTSLVEINIPDSVETIGEYAFCSCASLEKINIPEGIKIIGACIFDNCTSLEKITYKNKILSVKDIDGYCMVIKSSKILNDYQIYKAIYFDDYVRDNFKTVYCVQRGKFSSHGKTLKSAMQDITFKEMRNRDISEHISRVKSQGYVTPNDYRLITGACQQGTGRFLIANSLTWDDKMEISKVCELVKTEYGGSEFIEAMR